MGPEKFRINVFLVKKEFFIFLLQNYLPSLK